MDLYMGHGIGFNDNHAPWSNKHMGKIGKRNGVFNNYRIPFGKSIRVTAQRSPDSDGSKFIWWIIRGVENGRVRLGGVQLPETARLKLHRIENQVFKPLEEFDLCNVKGAGALYQVAIAGKALNARGIYFLEACMRGYLNRSEHDERLCPVHNCSAAPAYHGNISNSSQTNSHHGPGFIPVAAALATSKLIHDETDELEVTTVPKALKRKRPSPPREAGVLAVE
jgi:hypothetical protein